MHRLTEQHPFHLHRRYYTLNCSITSAFMPCTNLKEATCVNDIGLCHVHNTLSYYSKYSFADTDRPTAPSPLSKGMSRFAKIASIPTGSIHSVHKRRVFAAIASHRSVPDFLNDFDARILRNPFASMI